MATKKTEKSTARNRSTSAKTPAKAKPKAGAKPEKKPKGPTVKTGPRHPRARVVAAHGSKEALAKQLASVIARQDQDTDLLAGQLAKASNQQLLRLARASEKVKAKWGSRDKLIAAIGSAQKKGKDKDYLAKLETLSLPRLLDIAQAVERAARA